MRRLLPILLLAFPLLYIVSVSSEEPPTADCAADYEIPTVPALWSAQGGRISFGKAEGGPYVRLRFVADPREIKFDRDAALRVRLNGLCRPGENPLALDAEMRFSRVLSEGAELNDLMLIGTETQYLAGAGVPAAGEWVPIRISLPRETPDFYALHFGFGSQWVREHEGKTIEVELRNVVLRRRKLLHRQPLVKSGAKARWLSTESMEPIDYNQLSGEAAVTPAPGAPEYVLLEIPSEKVGKISLLAPQGIKVEAWISEWIFTETKVGVVAERPIRLLPYRGEKLGLHTRPHRVWIRLSTDSSTPVEGKLVVKHPGGMIERPISTGSMKVSEGTTRFQMYYQMNENWTGYSRYAAFYANSQGHFKQLRDFGFTGIHIAEEPKLKVRGGKVEVEFDSAGRYWQRWPHTLADLLNAALEADFPDPPIWEGLRIFRLERSWAMLQNACEPDVLPETRLRLLADAILPVWEEKTNRRPILAIADEPGTQSADEVAAVASELKALKAGGYRTYLTTHARMHDSFHKLASLLDINVLHAEDVTAEAAAYAQKAGGELWLYNGGSMNIGTPASDRFFAGVYGWAAGASGITQWVYTRPSSLEDPLDLRTMLSDDAQFYALPGHGAEPAATPGLIGFAAGIVDRRVLDFAEKVALDYPAVQKYLDELRRELELPLRPDEYAVYRLQKRVDPVKVRRDLLRLLNEV